jgi:hypothetical protein
MITHDIKEWFDYWRFEREAFETAGANTLLIRYWSNHPERPDLL